MRTNYTKEELAWLKQFSHLMKLGFASQEKETLARNTYPQLCATGGVATVLKVGKEVRVSNRSKEDEIKDIHAELKITSPAEFSNPEKILLLRERILLAAGKSFFSNCHIVKRIDNPEGLRAVFYRWDNTLKKAIPGSNVTCIKHKTVWVSMLPTCLHTARLFRTWQEALAYTQMKNQ